MGDSSRPGPLGRHLELSPRTPGSLGRGDAAVPGARLQIVGDTPGPLGRNDWGDPDHPAFLLRPPHTALLGIRDLPPLGAPPLRLRPPFVGRLSLGRAPHEAPLEEPYQGIPASKLTPCATDEETEFKHRVYVAACRAAATKRKYFAGVPGGLLVTVEGTYKMRADAAAAAKKLLAGVGVALKHAKAQKNAHALKVTSIKVTSGYRDPKKDFGLWDSYYANYYKQTRALRESAIGGPHGAQAVQKLAHYIGKYKAAPGYSNHTHGTAFDITTTEGGVHYTASKDQNAAWESTWLRTWMLKNAAAYGFHKLATEAWHWDFK